ncbi:hypothetical protein CO666_22090 [Rhizobium chutanense]|uniref:Uncharacterized protein n=1 Tax=Rhizobium chutanense TaxID=2035448 RepID=A0A2A6J6S2_9HYPH|nr:hypothetical protein CO666_22090 [Rhizobium chutanense]
MYLALGAATFVVLPIYQGNLGFRLKSTLPEYPGLRELLMSHVLLSIIRELYGTNLLQREMFTAEDRRFFRNQELLQDVRHFSVSF